MSGCESLDLGAGIQSHQEKYMFWSAEQSLWLQNWNILKIMKIFWLTKNRTVLLMQLRSKEIAL